MAWAIVYYLGVGSREPQCGNINSFHASVFLARQPMETGCPYPLNEDDPPVTRLVAMAPACHASPCPSLSLRLSDNTCRITECVDTPQGIKPLGQTWKGNTFHDRFTLDFECDTFTWEKDGKVTYANKIISHTAKYDHHSFTTGQIAANLTINSHRAVLQLIHFQNCQWIQVTYFCDVGN